jgi:hypothetical protein
VSVTSLAKQWPSIPATGSNHSVTTMSSPVSYPTMKTCARVKQTECDLIIYFNLATKYTNLTFTPHVSLSGAVST